MKQVRRAVLTDTSDTAKLMCGVRTNNLLLRAEVRALLSDLAFIEVAADSDIGLLQAQLTALAFFESQLQDMRSRYIRKSS